jgi:hypothetical protein
MPPRVGWVLLDADYTLREPSVKVTLSISHDIAAQLQEWNTAALRSPLSECLHRETSDTRNIFGREQPRQHGWRLPFHLHEFCCARHRLTRLPREFYKQIFANPLNRSSAPRSFQVVADASKRGFWNPDLGCLWKVRRRSRRCSISRQGNCEFLRRSALLRRRSSKSLQMYKALTHTYIRARGSTFSSRTGLSVLSVPTPSLP